MISVIAENQEIIAAIAFAIVSTVSAIAATKGNFYIHVKMPMDIRFGGGIHRNGDGSSKKE